MDLKKQLEERVEAAARAMCAAIGGAAPALTIDVEPPRNRDHGDFATNVAFALAKALRRPPLEVAKELASRMAGEAIVESAEAAPPGFVNFRLRAASSQDLLRGIIEAGAAYGQSDLGRGEKILIEFVSANPTGPLHIGHARNAVVGDCAARLLEATGHAVTREYYFNDAGVQMDVLGRSLRARYLQALGRGEPMPEGGYQGDYLKEIAAELAKRSGDGLADESRPGPFTAVAVEHILKTIDADLKAMGIAFSVWFSESSLHSNGAVDAALAKLRERGEIYEKDGAWWLRSSKFGDDKDRVVVKSDGSKTYVTPDLAYHENKFERGFERLIDVLGGDHHGYITRLRAGVQNLGHEADRIQFIIIQMVTLIKDGERIKISTRRGDFLPLGQAIQELGVDALRFFFVLRSADAQMNFDWELAKKQSMENPVYYVQYAHARCASLFKKAIEEGVEWRGPEGANLERMALEEEKALTLRMARYPEVVASAARALEPHQIVNYVRDLAQIFHSYFTKGTKDPSLRFVVPGDPELTHARLTLIAALRIVLANALGLIGVSAPERM